MLRILPALSACLLIVISALYTSWPSVAVEWGMIDDHEIFMFLGVDGILHLTEIPEVLRLTEATQWSESSRFRPTYYALRILETFLWGDNASAWYAVRTLIWIVFLLSVYAFVRQVLGWPFAFVLTAAVICLPLWSDVWCRAGVAEIYTTLGMSLYLFTLCRLNVGKPNLNAGSRVLWLVFFISHVCVLGSKENWLFLPIIDAWLLFALWRGGKASFAALLSVASSALFALWIFAGVLLGVQSKGHVYGQSTASDSVLARFTPIVEDFFARYETPLFSILTLCVLLIGAHGKSREWSALLRTLANHLPLLLVLFLVYVSQAIFYPMGIEAHGRYGFPAGLLIFAWWGAAALLFRDLLHSWQFPQVDRTVSVVAALPLLFFISPETVQDRYAQCVHLQSENVIFARRLDRAVELAGTTHQSFVMNSYGSMMEYEPVISIARRLRQRGFEKVYVKLYDIEPHVAPVIVPQLRVELERISREGYREANGDLLIKPLNQADLKNCVSLAVKKRVKGLCGRRKVIF